MALPQGEQTALLLSHNILDPKKPSTVNIDVYPDTRTQLPVNAQLTIGDLHGNALKFLFFLVKYDILQITKEDYNDIVSIYKKNTSELIKENLEKFSLILSKAKAKPVGTLRLIGDELADRGQNDYFTLKIFEALAEKNIPLEILISNHSIEFIEAYEKTSSLDNVDNFYPPHLSKGGQANSMVNLKTLLENGLVSSDSVRTIIEENYKPCLKAISYTISPDAREITIFGHACIDLYTVELLAMKLGVNYQDDTAKELAETIEDINCVFTAYARYNLVHTLYSHDQTLCGYSTGTLSPEKAPFEFLMWNRDFFNLKRPQQHPSGYIVNYVHGHDSRDPSGGNIFNLDNLLGKTPQHHEGSYNILISQQTILRNQNRPIREIPLPNPAKLAIAKEIVTSINQICYPNTSIAPPINPERFEIFVKKIASRLSLNELMATKALLSRIGEMQEYGESLNKIDYLKGRAATDLALSLTAMIENFLWNLPTNHDKIRAASQAFKVDFSRALHREDKNMAIHRKKWKPIVLNIAIAATVLGAIFLLGRAVYKKLSTHSSTLFNFNKSLIGAATKGEKKIKCVEKSLTAMENTIRCC